MPGISLGLSRINRLLSLLGSPNRALPVIHVAGTNGKGSVCSYIGSILDKASIRTCSFNSPHLVDAWDCIKIGGSQRVIDETSYNAAKRVVAKTNEDNDVQATSFELLTATAFVAFARQKAELDVAIVEVGMGGETDATNVVPPSNTLLSIITPVSLDHQKFLGETVAEIAHVKAGIIKPDTDVILAKQEYPEARRVVTEKAKQVGATLHDVALRDVELPQTVALKPTSYQHENALTALTAIDVMRHSERALSMLSSLSQITDEHIEQGIRSASWAGRLSRLTVPHPSSPATQLHLLADGAHNASSITALARYILSLPPSRRPNTLLTALSHPRSPSLLDPLFDLTDPETGQRVFDTIVGYAFDKPDGMEWVSSVDPLKIVSHLHQVELGGRRDDGRRIEGKATFEEALSILPLDSDSDGHNEREVLVAGSLYGISEVYKYARRSKKGV